MWQPVEHINTLPTRSVHLWRMTVAEGQPVLTRLARLLSEDERDRARRFHFEADRQRYILGRAVLRLLLAAYLKQHPQSLRFQYNQFGKPFLHPEQNPVNIQFNLSHSGDVILLGFVNDRPVGVDVERIDSRHSGLDIARRFFSPTEYQKLSRLSGEEQVESFFRCWTRKEAFIKAHGRGLSIPLNWFDVTLLPDEPPGILTLKEELGKREEWKLIHLQPEKAYMAAAAVQQPAVDVECFHICNTFLQQLLDRFAVKEERTIKTDES
ncbi:MAG: 4'-phosphopantetheinyl transferase superfamily protein [Calditrichaeota bacterium]|nr:4'-phosphopantetheinyl transferase superfamily protein [Calditrichota bacterium]